jgi:hypothetical protein
MRDLRWRSSETIAPDLAPSGFSVVDFVGLVPAVLCADKDRKPKLGERDERGTGEWVTTIAYGQ